MHRVRAWLSNPVPAAPLVFFRVSFAMAMLWETWRYASGGWIKELWIDPSFHFRYIGFEFVQPWSGDGMYWHFALLALAATAMLLGVAYRVAAFTFLLGFAYVFLLDQAQYLNHFYLVCLLACVACVLTPHRAGSIPALLWPAWRRAWVPRWQLEILRFQTGVVYAFAGIAKLDADWLSGAPLALWLSRFSADLPSWLDLTSVARAASWAGLCFDLLIVPALVWRRTRVFAFAAAVAFHLTNAFVFSIGIFPWLMIALTALFFPAARWASTAAHEPGRRDRNARGDSPALAAPAFALLVLYVVVQLVVPLRHWVYEGPVTWTEEGHRFAWRMKLRDKVGHARFHVESMAGEPIATVDPVDWLNRSQVRVMVGRPDMLRQFARHLREEYQRMGYAAVRVRVSSQVCLNGRDAHPLVDPNVDLASEAARLGAVAWITPPPASPARATRTRRACRASVG